MDYYFQNWVFIEAMTSQLFAHAGCTCYYFATAEFRILLGIWFKVVVKSISFTPSPQMGDWPLFYKHSRIINFDTRASYYRHIGILLLYSVWGASIVINDRSVFKRLATHLTLCRMLIDDFYFTSSVGKDVSFSEKYAWQARPPSNHINLEVNLTVKVLVFMDRARTWTICVWRTFD